MSEHKHAEIATDWFYNQDLVVFCKVRDDFEWAVAENPSWNPNYEYTVALPEVADITMLWLNGEDVEYCYDGGDEWTPMPKYCKATRTMLASRPEYRVKPKKEKRWILVHNMLGSTSNTFPSLDKAQRQKDYLCAPEDWQVVEIEVEV